MSAPQGLWGRLWRFVRPHRSKLVGVVSLNLLAAVFDVFSFTLLIPFLNALFEQPQLIPSNKVVSAILSTTIGFLLNPADQMGSLRNVIVLVLLAVTLKNVLVWLSGQIGAQLQEFVVRDLRDALYAHLLRLPMSWFTANKVGQVISRMLTDTTNAKAVVTELVTRSIWSTAQVVSTIAIMFAVSWKLSLASLVVVPLTVLSLQPVLRKLRKGYRRMGNEQGEITSMVQEVVSGIRLIKSYGAEVREEQRFVTRNAAFAQGYVRIGRLALMSGPVTETLGAVMAVSILWFGARLVLVEKSLDGALLVTFLIWVMVIVGGSGNNWGAVLGGLLLGWLWLAVEYLGPNLMGYVTAALPPGDLKTHLIDSAQHMRLVTLGIVLLLVLRFAPRGLIPEK